MSHNENKERAQRLKLPTSVVARIVKNSLPENAKISIEAKCVVSRAASVFVLNMATFATDHAQGKKRKMVQAEDVLAALKGLECERLDQKISHMVEAWKQKRAEKTADAAKKRADKRAAAKDSAATTEISMAPQETPTEDESMIETTDAKQKHSAIEDVSMISRDEDNDESSHIAVADSSFNETLPETVPL
ncbi:unnamed protein product, partial [Mesorhabditis belari]|uniref:DNA polymerase epsilon subunit 3 n=1 Tax=Mesorhabditis belari TaxID=2138241 RepID=A0AAF3FSE3_9BILA